MGRPSLRCQGGSWRGFRSDGRCPRMHVEAQARRSGNARRLMLRAAVVAGVVGAALVAPRISIPPLPAPPVASSLVLSFQDAGTKRGRRPIEATATVAGLSWEGGAPRRAWVRASEDGSEWTPWTELLVDADHGPDPGTAEAAEAAGQRAGLRRQGELAAVPGGRPSRGGSRPKVVETAGRQLGVLERAALVVRGIRLTDAESAGRHPPLRPSYPERNGGGILPARRPVGS